MDLTLKQKEAVELTSGLQDWHGSPRIGRLRGAAGSGKTTTLKEIISTVGPSTIITPTGKAAQRVYELTGVRASTIHRWLFKAKEDELTGKLKFEDKALEEIDRSRSGLVVLDEASMVDSELWGKIYDTCVVLNYNILIVGDHRQLAPITKDRNATPFSLMADDFRTTWTITLTEIHRQAMDNPIIAASVQICNGEPYEALMNLPRVYDSELVATAIKVLDAGGVVICHRNQTRHRLNTLIRAAKFGPQAKLQPGEPLLVLKNSYKALRFNGELFPFKGWAEEPLDAKISIYDHYQKNMEDRSNYTGYGVTDASDDGTVPLNVSIATRAVTGELEGFSISAIEKGSKKLYTMEPYLHVNYGYSLSCHRAQGSEWVEVLVVVEPSIQLDTEDGRRWSYTAVSRAKKNIYISFNPQLEKLKF